MRLIHQRVTGLHTHTHRHTQDLPEKLQRDGYTHYYHESLHYMRHKTCVHTLSLYA